MQVAKKLSWRGTSFRSPTLRDSGSGILVPVSVSAWFRLRFGCGFCCGRGWFRTRPENWFPLRPKKVPVTPHTRQSALHNKHTVMPCARPMRVKKIVGLLDAALGHKGAGQRPCARFCETGEDWPLTHSRLRDHLWSPQLKNEGTGVTTLPQKSSLISRTASHYCVSQGN